jgi:hypothetical protein
MGGARRHALFLGEVLLGVVARAVVMVAYRPAMVFPDTAGYLARAQDLRLSVYRPSGYSLALRLVRTMTDSLTAVALLQHLLGVALAVACYAFLVRRGVPRWGASLATLPLLLDPLQLVLEHYVLSDVLFEALIVTACLALLWRRRPPPFTVLVVGLLVGCAGLVRGAGTLLLPAFLVPLLCLRPRWAAVVAFMVGGAVPLVAYATMFHHQHGDFTLTQAGPRFLYARLAPVTPCQHLEMPSYERPLCPDEPVGSRPDGNAYMWAQHQANQWHFEVPPGLRQVDVVSDFDKRVVREQPLMYARVVATDLVRGFAPLRTYDVPGYPASYWLFQDHYWSDDTLPGLQGKVATGRFGAIKDEPAAASAMAVYRHWIFTPGPLMAAFLLVALVAVTGLGRARLSGDRVAVGLLSLVCMVPLITTAGLSGFSWRYQLPQIALLPTAAALGITAMAVGRRPGGPAPLPPLHLLDRAAVALSRSPMPQRWRPTFDHAVRRGWCQVALGVLAAAVVGTVQALLAAASGWCTPRTAALLGLLMGAVTLTALLVSRWRSTSGAATEAPPST